jgi:hypothetical protein
MPSPFPGIDPYLEAPELWEDVHAALASEIRAQLQPQLIPRYVAVLTPYVVYEDIAITETSVIKPDVAVQQRQIQEAAAMYAVATEAPFTTETALEAKVPARAQRIEVRRVGSDSLVAVIEMLSPTNKRFGTEGYESYRQKRLDLLDSDVHLLEIDLLRRGARWPTKDPLPDAPYFAFLSRANRRPQVEVWPMGFRERPPVLPVPLRAPDRDVALDLGAALARVYEAGAFALRIDYRREPPAPALTAADAAWIDARLRAAGVRGELAGG